MMTVDLVLLPEFSGHGPASVPALPCRLPRTLACA
jgi:hypothetical protein